MPSTREVAIPTTVDLRSSLEWRLFLASRFASTTLSAYGVHLARLTRYDLPVSFDGFARFLMKRPGPVLAGQTVYSMWSALQARMLLQGVVPTKSESAQFSYAIEVYNRASLASRNVSMCVELFVSRC
jgi:hypothetical protein